MSMPRRVPAAWRSRARVRRQGPRFSRSTALPARARAGVHGENHSRPTPAGPFPAGYKTRRRPNRAAPCLFGVFLLLFQRDFQLGWISHKPAEKPH